MLTESEVKFQFKASMNLDNCHHTLSRDEQHGLQRETITQKTHGGYGVGKSKSYFFMDGDEREFKSLDELLKAYNRGAKIVSLKKSEK